jgi:hypothetical protein
MAEPFKLEVVPETDPPTQDASADVARSDATTAMFMMALGALSKRALVALASMFSLLTAGSAFWLWFLTPKPDVYQIVSLTIYSIFILALNWLVRTR